MKMFVNYVKNMHLQHAMRLQVFPSFSGKNVKSIASFLDT